MMNTRIIFDCPLSPWWIIGGAGVILFAALFFAWRDTAKIGPTRRIIVLVLLVIATAILAAIAVSPRVIRTWRDPHKPQVAVLLDGSRSMLLADRYTGDQARWLVGRGAIPGNPADQFAEISREAVVAKLLADSVAPAGWAAKVSRQFDLAGFRFAGDVTPWPLTGDAPFAVDQEGYSTALGSVLDRIGRSVGSKGGGGSAQGSADGSGDRPRAIVLVSDGAGNIGADPTEVARVLGRLGTPVYVVAVGDPNPPRDVAVLDLRVPKRLNLGGELLVSADIAVTGFGASRIPVELLRDGEVIDRREIVSGPSDRAGRPTVADFSFVPDRPGVLRMSVRVPPQAGEQNPDNNQVSAMVEVDERKIRVLMIDSEPRWQFRFLRRTMECDAAVASTLKLCLLRPGIGPTQGLSYIATLPTDAKQLDDYDVIILGDVERAKLPDEFCKSLAQSVRMRSTALMVMAGRKGHYRELADTPLGEILPVTLKAGSGGGDPLEFTSRGGAPYEVELTEVGRTHLLTHLEGTDQENEAVWGRFVPLRWAAAVSGLAPGADSLLVHPDRLAGANKLPLLAVQQVGAGKVMFCGIDESWRWRREVGDKYFYRFWAQALRWMVKKPFSESDPDSNKARLALDRTESDVGQSVQVEAYCLGPDGYPLHPAKDGKDAGGAAQVSVRIEPEIAGGNASNVKAEQIVLTPAPGGWGIFRGKFTAGKPGTYILRPIVADYGTQPLNSPVKLTVTRVDLERNFAGQDRATLAAIAQASGGELLSIDQADRLADLLAARAESRTQTAEFSLTQHWPCYTALAVVLAALWLVRKRAGLA